MRLTLTLLTLCLPLTASAMCASPEPFVLPRPGSVLPPNPTLYLFNPPETYEKARAVPASIRARTASGASLAMTSKKLESVGDFEVFRLDVTARAGLEFHLEPAIGVSRSWKVRAEPVSGAALVLTRGKDLFSSWTCSYESSRVLDSSIAAPAYRIEFAETEAALVAGTAQSVVVEGDNDGFLQLDKAGPPARSVRLGHHNCWGDNFIWTTPKLAVRVTALLADGSERRSDTIFVLDAPKR